MVTRCVPCADMKLMCTSVNLAASSLNSVCCWDIGHADKPEANAAIIRHLMCCGKPERLLCPISLPVERPFSFLSAATLSLRALTVSEDPNQQTGGNVARAVKTSLWWTISVRHPSSSTAPQKPSFQAVPPHKLLCFLHTHCSRQLSSMLHVTETVTRTPPRTHAPPLAQGMQIA